MRISNSTQFNRLQSSLRELNAGLAIAEEQISTGKRATRFSGLAGNDARISIELRTAISTRETYVDNINSTKLRADVANAALLEMQTVATDLRVELIKQTQDLYKENLPIMNEFAKTQIDRLANLLNSQVAGVFVFSGPASNKPPIADADAIKTNFASAVNTVVDAASNTAATIQNNANTQFNDRTGTLGNNAFSINAQSTTMTVSQTSHGLKVGDKITFSGATAVAGLDMNDTFTVSVIDSANQFKIEVPTPANATVNGGGGAPVTYIANSFNSLGGLATTTEVTVNAATGLNISYGELANQESFANLFETLNIFANVQVAAGANEAQKQANQAEYRTLVDNARTVVEQAFDDINRMVADLGGDISRLNSAKETHKNEIELITKQLNDVENIDSFEAINRFQALRSQIEASYQITAASRGFSLLNFL